MLIILLRKTKTVRIAKKYIGEKEKTTGSYEYGFRSASFEKKMRDNGFREGYDWCAIFARNVITERLSGKRKVIIKKLMNPSSQRTYQNLVDDSKKYSWIKLSEKPTPGALVVWQKVESPAYGHVGIVKKVKKNKFITIEGNVSTGTGYDGVAVKEHQLAEKNKTGGLKLRKYFIKIT